MGLVVGVGLPAWVWWLICVVGVGVVDLCCGGFENNDLVHLIDHTSNFQ